MNAKFLLISVLLIAGLVIASCNNEVGTPSGGNISVVLDSLELKLNWLDYRLAVERWDSVTGGAADSLRFFKNLQRAALSDERTFHTLRGGADRLKDETSQRFYSLVYPEVLHAYVNNSRSTRGIYDSLAGFYERDEVEFDGGVRSLAYLTNLVERSGSRSDRELAYRTLYSPGETIASQVSRLFRLRNQVAKRFGYNNYFALADNSQQNGSTDYLELISAVDSVTRADYRQVFTGLRDNFREGSIEIWDWRHAFADTWRELDRFFPADSQIRFLKRSLAGMGFDLDNTPIYFHELGDSAAPAYAETIVMMPPYDIRIVCNLTDGIRSMQHLMKAVGAAVHAAEISEESYLLSTTVDPAWSEGIARFFEELCLEPAWLRTYARVPEGLVNRVVQARRADDLLELRLLVTNAMFEYEAYRNPNTDLNDVWWRLFETYTMLPVNEDLQPWAMSESFVTEALGYRDRLQAEVIAAQTTAYLNDFYGAVVENAEVRSFLVHNYLRFGGRYPWPELVERATGDQPSPAFLAGRW